MARAPSEWAPGGTPWEGVRFDAGGVGGAGGLLAGEARVHAWGPSWLPCGELTGGAAVHVRLRASSRRERGVLRSGDPGEAEGTSREPDTEPGQAGGR